MTRERLLKGIAFIDCLVKEIQEDRVDIAVFEDEVTISYPNFIKNFGYSIEGGVVQLGLEEYECDLTQFVKKIGQKLTVWSRDTLSDDFVNGFRKLVEAVEYVHSKGKRLKNLDTNSIMIKDDMFKILNITGKRKADLICRSYNE